MSGTILQFPGGADASGDRIAAVEALLFAAGEPVTVAALGEALHGVDEADVQAAIDAIARRCAADDRGVEVVEVGGAWQMRSKAAFGALVVRLRGGRPQKLSRPALEVLSVVAYRQPATRQEIEQIRGVDSGAVLKSLLERQLVRVSGRRDEPGRPLEYATTPLFLEMFSLRTLSALPTLREREELVRDRDDEGPIDGSSG